MTVYKRNRTLRPSSRKKTSPYKIDTKKVTSEDTLLINIDHEDDLGNVLYQYEIDGSKVASLNSIHFNAISTNNDWEFSWSGAIPKRKK